MDDYKVVYEDLLGMKHVTEWMDFKRADAFFSKLGLNVVWAELLYSPIDNPSAPDGESVIKQITNRKVMILGKTVIITDTGKDGKPR